MTDIAALGLSVDSSQVDKGSVSLTKFAGAAKVAEAASKGVTTGSRGAAAAASAIVGASDSAAGALTRQAAAARQAATAMKGQAVAVNDNVRRMSGSFSGMAAQWQDIGVTASMGMHPFIIGLQQGTQMAGQMEMAMQGGASAAGVLGNAFKSLFQPLTFISIGLTVLAAAGLQMVDWVSVGQTALTGLADAIEVIAPYATMAAAGLALLYAPAILVGIKAVTVGLWGLTRAIGAAALAFAVANPGMAFVIGITAAVAAANIFRDELTKIFGVDIVGIAKDAANFVINSFVAAYSDIKFVWNNFGDMMGAAVVGGVNIAVRAINSLIEKASAGIDWLIDKVNPYLEMGGMDPLKNVGGQFSLGELDNPFADRFSKANSDHAAEIAGIMSRDTIGDFGGAITRGASAAASKLKELAAGLGETADKTKKAKSEAEKLAEKYDRIVLGARQFIAAQQLEAQTLGMSEQAANALRYEQDLLNEAQRAGINLTAAQRAELAGLAGQMASTEAATKSAKEALEFNKDLTRGFINDLRQGLANGEGFWKAFGNAALNVLDKITDKLLNDVIDALFQVNKAGSGFGGGGGLLGMIGGLFGASMFPGGMGFATPGYVGTYHTGGIAGQSTAMRMANPSLFINAPRYHNGGIAGDEVPAILRRGEIVSRDMNHLRQQAGNTNDRPAYNDNRVYNFTGTSEEFEQFKQFVAQRDAQFDARAVQAVKGYHAAGNTI